MKPTSVLLYAVFLLSCNPATQPSPQAASASLSEEKQPDMIPALHAYTDSLCAEFDLITPERKALLAQLGQYIKAQREKGDSVRLTFICTHNSRRSHMGQIWAAAAARYYGMEAVSAFSGGTEATAFNPRAVAALKRAGFLIADAEGSNPQYRVQLTANDTGLLCFSKKYDDPINPQKDFAAVMTCSQADADCPVIFGADMRLALPYNDPKEADNTPQETARYDERCRQIGREILYAFSLAL